MALATPSGVMYSGNIGIGNGFPQNLRRGRFSRFEPRFTGIFFGLLFVISVTVLILSHGKVQEEAYTEKEMLKIQERYAQLVLNQPVPKVEEIKKTEIAKVATGSEEKTTKTEAPKEEEVKVDRAKETFTEKARRKESGVENRRQVREQAARQIQSAGIFAAITASGDGSGSNALSSATDLLGTAGLGVTDLGALSVSKGTFAAKNVDPAELVARKETRTAEVNIEREEVGKAAVTQVASNVEVAITTAAPEVTGESATLQERSQSAIQNIVSRESRRLKRLYEEWLKRDPSLGGRLTVKFVILPSGAVANVSIVKSTTGNGEFDEMVVRYIKRWQFSAVEGAGSVEVVYPFVFEGQN